MCCFLCIQLRHQETHTSNNHNWIKGRSSFQFGHCWHFIKDLLILHRFEDVKVINRTWRTREANHIAPFYPTQCSVKSMQSIWFQVQRGCRGSCTFMICQHVSKISTELDCSEDVFKRYYNTIQGTKYSKRNYSRRTAPIFWYLTHQHDLCCCSADHVRSHSLVVSSLDTIMTNVGHSKQPLQHTWYYIRWGQYHAGEWGS